jgi:hypothetical protein
MFDEDLYCLHGGLILGSWFGLYLYCIARAGIGAKELPRLINFLVF